MRLYSPFADRCVDGGGYRGGLVYSDVQAVYPYQTTIRRRDSRRTRKAKRKVRRWVLRDRRGRALYVPFGCTGRRCPQYAADIGSKGWRSYEIRRLRRAMRHHYKGIFLDDVNFNLNVSRGSGAPAGPIDPRTRRAMTPDAWQAYMAGFVRRVRAAFPTKELMMNMVWWKPESSLDDPDVRAALEAASHVELERGTEDVFRGQPYLGLLATMDRLHAAGVGFNLDGYLSGSRSRAEFELGTYFLASDGRDTVGADYGSCPTNSGRSPCQEDFWKGYKVHLGPPSGPRATRPDGLLERRFAKGLVLVNPPGAPRRQVRLDSLYTDIDGTLRLFATLDGGQALILRK
jgi:putative glycosyl hydrolase-like family 15 (GHL15) protein